MALEVGVTTIADLNPLNPSAADPAMEGDDHIRLIKAALKATFPNINAAITPKPVDINKLDGMTATKSEMNFLAGVTSAIQTQLNALKPAPGIVVAFAGSISNVPAGYLPCDGRIVSRTTYAALFAVIGASWGAGDGSTTFKIPDYRGYFLRGLDTGAGIDAGRILGSYQEDQFQSHSHAATSDTQGNHSHSYSDPGHSHSYTDIGGNGGSGGGESYQAGSGQLRTFYRTTSGAGIGITINADGSHAHNITVGSPNSGNRGTETRPKNAAVNYIIKT